MSNSRIHVGLAIIGGLVLAAVVAWNAWTTRRNTPRQPDACRRRAGHHAGGWTAPNRLQDRTEANRCSRTSDACAAAIPAAGRPRSKPGLDALIDVLAPSPSTRRCRARPRWPPCRRRAAPAASPSPSKAATSTPAWETPRAGQRYSAFQAGVQLANRNGALNEIEYSEFVMKAQAFADAINGAPEFPEMRDEVARARELDQFASAHDAQLSFTLRAATRPGAPATCSRTRRGWASWPAPSRAAWCCRRASRRPPVLGLAFDTQAALADDPAQSAIRELTLSLDVPQVPRSEQPFAACAKPRSRWPRTMDGVITDDDGRVIRARRWT
jgi:hypothetical protein